MAAHLADGALVLAVARTDGRVVHGWAPGAVMAAEKNLPGGRRLGAPLGVGLLLWSAAITLWHVWPLA